MSKKRKDSFDDDLQSKYLKAVDIEDEQPVNWTISDIDRRPVGPEGELKRCLSFVEHKKPMTLNITNIRVLRDLFGPDPDTLRGKRVQLYTTNTDFGGKSYHVIRLAPASSTTQDTLFVEDNGQ